MNKAKKLLNSGGVVINGWLSIPNSFSTQVMANAKFDALTIDMQHGVHDYKSTSELINIVALNGITPFVRVPWLEAGIIMKVLDSGAYGLIVPMINTKNDAIKVVEYARYPPFGSRSFGPIRANFLYDNYYESANEEVLLFVMIETKEAVSNIDDILSIKGIDGVYVGPADLSLSFGAKPKFDQEDKSVVKEIDFILKKAKEYNKFAGIHNGSSAYSKKMIDKGFGFVTLNSDARLMLGGAIKEVSSLKNSLNDKSNKNSY